MQNIVQIAEGNYHLLLTIYFHLPLLNVRIVIIFSNAMSKIHNMYAKTAEPLTQAKIYTVIIVGVRLIQIFYKCIVYTVKNILWQSYILILFRMCGVQYVINGINLTLIAAPFAQNKSINTKQHQIQIKLIQWLKLIRLPKPTTIKK